MRVLTSKTWIFSKFFIEFFSHMDMCYMGDSWGKNNNEGTREKKSLSGKGKRRKVLPKRNETS